MKMNSRCKVCKLTSHCPLADTVPYVAQLPGTVWIPRPSHALPDRLARVDPLQGPTEAFLGVHNPKEAISVPVRSQADQVNAVHFPSLKRPLPESRKNLNEPPVDGAEPGYKLTLYLPQSPAEPRGYDDCATAKGESKAVEIHTSPTQSAKGHQPTPICRWDSSQLVSPLDRMQFVQDLTPSCIKPTCGRHQKSWAVGTVQPSAGGLMVPGQTQNENSRIICATTVKDAQNSSTVVRDKAPDRASHMLAGGSCISSKGVSPQPGRPNRKVEVSSSVCTEAESAGRQLSEQYCGNTILEDMISVNNNPQPTPKGATRHGCLLISNGAQGTLCDENGAASSCGLGDQCDAPVEDYNSIFFFL
jgi:hypothetical protein